MSYLETIENYYGFQVLALEKSKMNKIATQPLQLGMHNMGELIGKH